MAQNWQRQIGLAPLQPDILPLHDGLFVHEFPSKDKYPEDILVGCWDDEPSGNPSGGIETLPCWWGCQTTSCGLPSKSYLG